MSLGTPTLKPRRKPTRLSRSSRLSPATSNAHASLLELGKPQQLPAGWQPREDWECWQAHLAARQTPLPLAKLLSAGKRHPLLWALPDEVRPAWLGKRGGNTAQLAAEAFFAGPACGIKMSDAIECLAWCHALPNLAARLDEGTWWSVLDRLIEAAQDSAGISLAEYPLEKQLFAGELPLTLAYCFPELPECSRLADLARSALSRGPAELLDGEGAPAAGWLPLLRPLLACWTRSAYLGRGMGAPCFSAAPQAEFEWLVRYAMTATRQDGRQVLTPGPRGCWQPDLFAAALVWKNDWEDAQIADCALPGRSTKRTLAKRRELPAPPTHSETSESALLRYDWHRGGDFLALTFHQRQLAAELNCGRDTLWSGSWNPSVSVEGRMLAPASNWEVVCWHTDDDDVVYLELEMNLGEGWRIQRQLLLAGSDRFLLACDSVLGSQPAAIEYKCSLPLAEGTRFEHADETREGLLITGRRRRLVLPLALPEWQAERTTGSFKMTAEGLTLSQTAEGSGLFAPLFVDLDPSRSRLQRTWRRLTVAEKLAVLPHDVAAGYRVQIGAKQWLAYRSFRQPSNRSVLGQNVANECLVARFLRTGEIEELLEIE